MSGFLKFRVLSLKFLPLSKDTRMRKTGNVLSFTPSTTLRIPQSPETRIYVRSLFRQFGLYAENEHYQYLSQR
jgi:hypothetical protein